jgi:FG-GAP-like repeat/FG-GAP repeat
MDRDRGGRLSSGLTGRSCALFLVCVTALMLSVMSPPARSTQSSALQRPSFAGPRNYTTAKSPESVAVGDLNGDSKPDLVTVSDADPGVVSVLLNRSAGTFRAARMYRIRAKQLGSLSVALGDLTGDHRPDLATADSDADTVSILINRGDGSFRPSGAYLTGAAPRDVAIGDLNGDGRLDLAIANEGADSVAVLMNKGDGSFGTNVGYGTGRGSKPQSVAIADLNGDHKPDLAIANFSDTVSVFLNRGDGSFRARRDFRAGSGPRSIAIGDLNRDSKPDLVTANHNTAFGGGGAFVDSVSVLLNEGDGSFRPKLDYRPRVERGFGSVAIGDLNGDGKPDVATGNDTNPGTDSVLLNKGRAGSRKGSTT